MKPSRTSPHGAEAEPGAAPFALLLLNSAAPAQHIHVFAIRWGLSVAPCHLGQAGTQRVPHAPQGSAVAQFLASSAPILVLFGS